MSFTLARQAKLNSGRAYMYGFGLLSLGAFGLGMDFMKVARREQFKMDQANENLTKFEPINLIGKDAVNYPW